MQFIRAISVVAALLIATVASAFAKDWPSRHLTLVVPFSAGGSSDTIARCREAHDCRLVDDIARIETRPVHAG